MRLPTTKSACSIGVPSVRLFVLTQPILSPTVSTRLLRSMSSSFKFGCGRVRGRVCARKPSVRLCAREIAAMVTKPPELCSCNVEDSRDASRCHNAARRSRRGEDASGRVFVKPPWSCRNRLRMTCLCARQRPPQVTKFERSRLMRASGVQEEI